MGSYEVNDGEKGIHWETSMATVQEMEVYIKVGDPFP